MPLERMFLLVICKEYGDKTVYGLYKSETLAKDVAKKYRKDSGVKWTKMYKNEYGAEGGRYMQLFHLPVDNENLPT